MNLRSLLFLMCVVAISVAVEAQAPSIPPGPTVLVLDGDYHLEACTRLYSAFVNKESPVTMSLADAMRQGAGPCRLCRPNTNKEIGAFVANYTGAISREMAAVREAGGAERRRLADIEAQTRIEAARAEADAARANAESAAVAARAKAEADRKRREAEPLIRVTNSQARAILSDAGPKAKNDVATFVALFVASLAKLAPDFKGPQSIADSDGLSIFISGPLGNFFAEARERVRKFEPLVPPPVWSAYVQILVSPDRIDAPDIEKIIVQRNGSVIAPIRTALVMRELVTAIGAKRMIHSGTVTYPVSAFEPGAGVTVTVIAIPASGSNITRTFDSIELRAIQ